MTTQERTTSTTDLAAAGSATPEIQEAIARNDASQNPRAQTWRRFKRYRPALFGLGFIILLLILAIFAKWIAPYDPEMVNTKLSKDPPSWDHWLGNDDIGRDILSRIIYGTRVALIVGVGATSIAVTIGVFVGAT